MNQYTYDLKKEFKILGVKTSKTEIKDIAIAWLMLSLAFFIMINGGGFENPFASIVFALFALVAVGSGFIVHELSHKLVAMHFGYPAEFRKDMSMLVVSIVMSFFGFIFAAPGGVYILGNVSRVKNGIISFAGPFSNFVVALIFLPFLFLTDIGFITLLMQINLFLALFNMIPILNFDGAKIWRWNKAAYLILIISAGVLFAYLTY